MICCVRSHVEGAREDSVIEMRRAQLSFGDGLIAEEVSDLREGWMEHADRVLADEQIVAAVYEALARWHPKSRSRGRLGAPAEMVLRLLILKHIRNWSYGVLERETEMADRMRGTHQRGQAATRARSLPLQRRCRNEALGRARRHRRQHRQHRSHNGKTIRSVVDREECFPSGFRRSVAPRGREPGSATGRTI